jgi:hypothetical protein
VLAPAEEFARLRIGGKSIKDTAGVGAAGRREDPAVTRHWTNRRLRTHEVIHAVDSSLATTTKAYGWQRGT